MAELQPPQEPIEDPGAHELEDSSDDHYSSASEGQAARTSNPVEPPNSPPITRVERVDDRPAHGEVPGTSAYAQRAQDAVPDEIEVVPDGQRSRSNTTRSRATSSLSARSGTDSPVPHLVVERVDDRPAHGEVDGTPAKEMRSADAEPDEVRRVSQSEGREEGDNEQRPLSDEEQQTWLRDMWQGNESKDATSPGPVEELPTRLADDAPNDDDDFGVDFDDFAEGQGDDDFGDFDEAEDAPATPVTEEPPQTPLPDLLEGLPPISLMTSDDIDASLEPYLDSIFPSTPKSQPTKDLPAEVTGSAFLSDRSLSLWQQLLQPPPMAPPNWTRSRIRRLFLVSLGVPVDLDEVLPPSKQKRLVLPNINITSSSPRPSTTIDRLKLSSANNSSTSIDSKGAPKPKSKRTAPARGPPQPPDFDLNAAALLCSTTVEALANMLDEELREHVGTLDQLNGRASGVLEYWLMRRDEGLKEKEALEGVIENLVGFVKGRRGK